MPTGATPSAEERIRHTLARFAHCTDAGDYDAWVSLFAEDGRFRMAGREHVGHAALRAFIEDDQPPGRRGLHLSTDSVIRIEGGTSRVRSNFMFIAHGPDGPVLVAIGRYLDILVPHGDKWLFREREAILEGPRTRRP